MHTYTHSEHSKNDRQKEKTDWQQRSNPQTAQLTSLFCWLIWSLMALWCVASSSSVCWSANRFSCLCFSSRASCWVSCSWTSASCSAVSESPFSWLLMLAITSADSLSPFAAWRVKEANTACHLKSKMTAFHPKLVWAVSQGTKTVHTSVSHDAAPWR